MDRHHKKIIILNIVSVALQIVYAMYLLRVIFTIYYETENKVMAGIVIPIASIIIINLFFVSTKSMLKGLYERLLQKWAAIFFIMFVTSSDVLIYNAFITFHILGKILFVMVNIVAIIHLAKKYLFKSFSKRSGYYSSKANIAGKQAEKVKVVS